LLPFPANPSEGEFAVRGSSVEIAEPLGGLIVGQELKYKLSPKNK